MKFREKGKRLGMWSQHLLTSRLCCSFLVCWIVLSSFPGFILSAVVTLRSVQIFTTHEWFSSKPTVFFQCKGEKKTVLPDVKKADMLYTFKGEESWQPLTELQSTKCKRCGFYEQDSIKSNDIFDEWEFCPSEFKAKGKYIHFKEKEINATFLCLECAPLSAASKTDSGSHNEEKRKHIALVVVISTVASIVVIVGVVAAFKCWQKRKRRQDQARFLKLFEDSDEIEDELGLGNVL